DGLSLAPLLACGIHRCRAPCAQRRARWRSAVRRGELAGRAAAGHRSTGDRRGALTAAEREAVPDDRPAAADAVAAAAAVEVHLAAVLVVRALGLAATVERPATRDPRARGSERLVAVSVARSGRGTPCDECERCHPRSHGGMISRR